MAMSSRGRPELPRHSKERESSPERTRVWTEPKSKTKAKATERKVPVVYYLSRNGHLEHPHFMEVSLSSSEALYLRDVVTRLNFLRGKGMASMYSWSSKRSYKNGFVWHDLSEDDIIYPALGHEYVLKGSELLREASPMSQDTPTSAASSSSSDRALEIPRSVQDDSDSPLIRRKKTLWNSLDLTEYKVYKTESTAEAALKAADASTQTDDRRQWRRALERAEAPNHAENPPTELGRDEISPPPSSSSPETLETLIKADGSGGIVRGLVEDPDRAADNYPSGRTRASAVLMHLISCGSISVKDHGFSMVSQYRSRLPRGGTDQAVKEMENMVVHTRFPASRLEDKEYFSGSLIETKKKAAAEGGEEFPALKRSSSYNADRSSKLELAEKEIDSVQAKCIPRKLKPPTGKKEGNATISRTTHGSKRITDEPPK